MKSFYLKEKILNQIMLNGNKYTTENLLFKSLKRIQKNYNKKNSKELIKIGIVNSSPVIFLKQIKRKRKRTIEFPFLLNKMSRISYGLKFLIKSSNAKKANLFYKQFELEFVDSSKNLSESSKKKKNIHTESFLKKKFANYRWF